MKSTLSFAILLPLLAFTGGIALSQTTVESKEEPIQYIATIKRSTSGEKLNENGFGAGTVQLQSGMTYEVEKQDLGSVTLRDGDILIRVNRTNVDVMKDDGSASVGDFFRIVSASYRATTGGTRYNVKHEIQKRLPRGPLTQPVQILIDDHLLRARANEVNSQTAVARQTGPDTYKVKLDAPKQMILTIVYEYNGQRFTKEVAGGDYLVLP